MTDRYAVIGNPIAHSKSPLIHASFARATHQDIEYAAILAPLDGFAAAVEQFRRAGGRGLNVTAPFKLQAFELATDRLERARDAQASNALKFEGDRIYADNFDGNGLVRDIQDNLGFRIAGRRILLLGAGGAARGLLRPFLEQKPALVVVANRRIERAAELVQPYRALGRIDGCGYDDLAQERFDLVVNATSASMRGESLPLPAEVFGAGTLAYELVYGKGLTPFLRQAQAAGATQLADGVGMLVEQAAEAFLWWRGVRPETRAVIAELAVPLV